MDAPPVQYARTSDGFDIAYTVCGDGPPMLFFPPGFLSVQSYWWLFPEWMEGLAKRFRLVCYDSRGEGLSSRGLPEGVSLDDLARDPATVLGLFPGERFLFYALGGRGHDAVRYAVAHPDRVTAFVWNMAQVKATAWPTSIFFDLPRQNWRVFLEEAIAPHHLGVDHQKRVAEEYSRCITRDDWIKWTNAFVHSSVENELLRMRVPTLVLHPRDYLKLPIEESRRTSALIPNARFMPIDGRWIYGDATQGLAAIDAFLSDLRRSFVEFPEGQSPESGAGLSSRELEVLSLLTTGKSNQQIAEALVISESTVAKHVTSILDKTGAANRTEAAAYAHKHGLV
jgi:DNA-binding CsgD family transcriptional regulator/pimeloyl-ACP methyl ester carboxylesterase